MRQCFLFVFPYLHEKWTFVNDSETIMLCLTVLGFSGKGLFI